MLPSEHTLTAIRTPLGPYEWIAMPMGCKNAPATLQRRMEIALRRLIGRTCYCHFDGIIIWSNTLERIANVRKVPGALRAAKLFSSPKKTILFANSVDFLGHNVSASSSHPDQGKTRKIGDLLRPFSGTRMRAFLGLVRYLAPFLPNFAGFTNTWTSFTTNAANKIFPEWTSEAEEVFLGVKRPVLGADCLTTVDHEMPKDRRKRFSIGCHPHLRS